MVFGFPHPDYPPTERRSDADGRPTRRSRCASRSRGRAASSRSRATPTSRSATSARARPDGRHVYIKRKGVALDEVEPRRRDRRRPRRPTCVRAPEHAPRDGAAHRGLQARAPTSARVVHGHPPYATAFGATDASSSCSPTTACCSPTASRPSRRRARPDHRRRAGRGGRAGARRRARALLLRNHGVLVVGKDVPWAVLAGVTLERAVRLQAIAAHARPAAPDRAGARARADGRDKYQDRLRRRVLGRLACASCSGSAAASGLARTLRLEIELTRQRQRRVRATVAPTELLLDFLRERLGLTGAKRSCDVQVCGACTVLRRRRARQRVLLPRGGRRRARRADDRGLRRAARVRPARAGVHPPRGAPVRLLHARAAAHAQQPAATRASSASEEQIRHGLDGQHLPLHRLPRRSSRPSRELAGVDRREHRRADVESAEVGRLGAAHATPAEKLRGQAQFAGDMSLPGMLHGKVLRSPVAHARIVCDRHRGGRGDAGRRLRAHRRRPRRHRPVLGPRDQGPPDRRDRQGALPRRARRRGRRRERGRGRGGGAGDRGRLRGAAGRRRRRAGARARRAAVHERAAASPGSSTGSASSPQRDGNICYRYRIDRGEVEAVFAHARHRRRGRVHVPRGLPVRDGDAHRRSRSRGDGEITLWAHRASTRSSCGPSSPTSSACRSRSVRVIVAVPRRRLRLEVLHQDGAAHRRARAQGAAGRCGSATASTSRW